MAYIRTIDRLGVACIDKEQRARTCGYWYCVQSYGTPQTAFRTRSEFLQWLELYGLQVEGGEVPEEGRSAWLNIIGQYREASHLDGADWETVEGIKIMALSNGQYTEWRIAPDADGTICGHYLNPNVRDRPRFDYRQAQARRDAGRADFMLSPIDEPLPY